MFSAQKVHTVTQLCQMHDKWKARLAAKSVANSLLRNHVCVASHLLWRQLCGHGLEAHNVTEEDCDGVKGLGLNWAAFSQSC